MLALDIIYKMEIKDVLISQEHRNLGGSYNSARHRADFE